MDNSSDSASLVYPELVPQKCEFLAAKGKKKCERTHSDSSRFRSTKWAARQGEEVREDP